MDALSRAAHEGKLPELQQLLPAASPIAIINALGMAVAGQHDGAFDLLLSHADPHLAARHALRPCVHDGYRHGLGLLLPHADLPTLTTALHTALSQDKRETSLRILARMPPRFDASNLMVTFGLDAGPEVTGALIPFASSVALARTLFNAALDRSASTPILAAATDPAAVTTVVVDLLEYRWSGDGDATPPAYFAAADFLLSFVPAPAGLEIVARFPGIAPYPNASAALHEAALEASVPAAVAPRPRI